MKVFRRKGAKESKADLYEQEHARLAKESGTVEFSGPTSDASKEPGSTAEHGEFARGPCPAGKLTITRQPKTICPGFKPQCGTIVLLYNIPSGTQSHVHPHPGQPFAGVQRMSYIPDNVEGQKLLSRYQLCWLRGESLEIGYSVALKRDDQVKWRDQVPHKTSLTSGGPFGWPDPSFLAKANQALDSLGIPNSDECLELLPHSKLFKNHVGSETKAFEADDSHSYPICVSSAQTLLSDLKVLQPPSSSSSSSPSSPTTVVNSGPYPTPVASGVPSTPVPPIPLKRHTRQFSAPPQITSAGQQQQMQQHPIVAADVTHRRTQSVQHAQNDVLGYTNLHSQSGDTGQFSGMGPTFKVQCDLHPHECRTARLPPNTSHTPMVPMSSTALLTESVETPAIPMATSVVHVKDEHAAQTNAANASGGGIFLVKFQRKDADTLETAQPLPSKGGSDTLEAMRAKCYNAVGMNPFHATPEEAAAVEKKEQYFEVTFGAEGDTPIVGEWHLWKDFSVGDVAELIYPGGGQKNVTIRVELRDVASGRS